MARRKNLEKGESVAKKKYFEIIGSYLKDKRIEKGITQQEVATKAQLSTSQYISNIERGLAPPSIEVLRICVELYGIDPDELAFRLSKEYRQYLLEEISLPLSIKKIISG